MIELLKKIISQGESEGVDFKIKWHSNNAKLLHDILCLSNSKFDGDRYLLFGVNDSGEAVGLSDLSCRKNQANVSDFIRSLRLNILPTIYVKTAMINNESFDILTIKNLPEKPYFLVSDYRDGQDVVRAGVVYTRIADTNTPLTQTSDDKKIEDMYRERFRLDRPPLERLVPMLREFDSWEYSENSGILYYNIFWPEMRIKGLDERFDTFDEPWVKVFPDENAYRYYLEIDYLGTQLKKLYWISCDGGRYHTLQPKTRAIQISENVYRRFFYFIEDSIEFKLNQMMQAKSPIHEEVYNPGILLFSTKFEANNFFQNEAHLNSLQLTYYLQSGSGATYRVEKIENARSVRTVISNAQRE